MSSGAVRDTADEETRAASVATSACLNSGLALSDPPPKRRRTDALQKLAPFCGILVYGAAVPGCVPVAWPARQRRGVRQSSAAFTWSKVGRETRLPPPHHQGDRAPAKPPYSPFRTPHPALRTFIGNPSFPPRLRASAVYSTQLARAHLLRAGTANARRLIPAGRCKWFGQSDLQFPPQRADPQQGKAQQSCGHAAFRHRRFVAVINGQRAGE